jgi:C-terminal processing protease CtpA/Prc
MNRFRWIKESLMLVALLGTMFLSAYRAPAQEQAVIQASPVQSQEPFSVRFNVDDRAVVSNRSLWLWDTADDMLGANLQPVGDTLRTQLGIPAGEGLVVEGLRGEGASAQAGLQQNDILLSLADKPLGKTDDVIKHLKAAGDSPVPLKILRSGKPVTLRVRPIYRVTLGPVGEQKTEYYIGVTAVGTSDAIRAQLGLAEGQGVVVSEVVNGSPAEKAGIKKYDIILGIDDKQINTPEKLAGIVQDAKERPIQLQILRAGKHLTFSVTAATKKVEANPNAETSYRLLFLNRYEGDAARLGLVNTIQSFPYTVQNGQPVDANDLRQRLDHLEKELTAVRAALDKINETLKANQGNKRD